MTSLEASIDAGRALGRMAFYFGCWDRIDHFLHDTKRRHVWGGDSPQDLCRGIGLLDGGLLKNGKHLDVYDGRVWWTCCGARAFWYAFYWWDNSIDRRGGFNSGFYVRGFGWPEEQAAFDYACEQFPAIVARQKYPLVLQEKKTPGS